jgi:gamma-glutamylcyclotransferase (GGCT)/AIG2-like uncharacterized protein YtfP|mmetsp:Transcript_2824/g.10799  ORF Transcript_2824/g.10799 Transcript_2824/m.10799 type:complete len:87 (+) Transcript_2824:4658-4918(+)
MSRFVYGSLMAPEVLHALLGRVPAKTPGTVLGYARHPLKNRAYPGMVRVEDNESSSVLGDVLSGMTKRELAVRGLVRGEGVCRDYG